MKLAKVAIENFRHLGTSSRPLEISFTDALDRVRDFTLLVGPNTSGKTTILDAIACSLLPGFGMRTLRPGLKLSPRAVVRRGELQAKVTCWLRFNPEELNATQAIRLLADKRPSPDAAEVKLTWTYPRRTDQTGDGVDSRPSSYRAEVTCEPRRSELLLRARDDVARLMETGRVDPSWLHRVGSVFQFDQDRSGRSISFSRHARSTIHGTVTSARNIQKLRTTDPRSILVDLALQSLVPAIASNGKHSDEFQRIQESYARICAPRRLVGAGKDELGEFDVYFRDGEHDYTYEGLSSGEKNVLLFLIRFVAERIHRSVVLIDELELNQHPIWQRKLLHMIPQMGEGNQIIATTHSPYLREAVRPDAVIDLGALDEQSITRTE